MDSVLLTLVPWVHYWISITLFSTDQYNLVCTNDEDMIIINEYRGAVMVSRTAPCSWAPNENQICGFLRGNISATPSREGLTKKQIYSLLYLRHSICSYYLSCSRTSFGNCVCPSAIDTIHRQLSFPVFIALITAIPFPEIWMIHSFILFKS